MPVSFSISVPIPEMSTLNTSVSLPKNARFHATQKDETTEANLIRIRRVHLNYSTNFNFFTMANVYPISFGERVGPQL